MSSDFSGQSQTYQCWSLITGKGARQESQWQREMKVKLWIGRSCPAQQMTAQPQDPVTATHTQNARLTPSGDARKATTVR